MINRLPRSLKRFPEKKENKIVVNFDNLKTYTNPDGFRFATRTVTISGMYDNAAGKYVIATVDEPVRDILLWSGAEYDAIGQWTNNDVLARINELFKTV